MQNLTKHTLTNKFQKKQALTAIALILMLTLTALLAGMQSANAAVYAEIQPNAHVMIAPDLVGVGQQVVVTFRLDRVTPTATSPSAGDRWQNLKLTITNPDGTTETKGPYTADSTGGTWTIYTPTKVGNYTFELSFPGQWINYTSGGVSYTLWYKATTSQLGTLRVQEQNIPAYPDNPIPTGYWTRPINAENKGWWQITDNWLMAGYDYMSRTFAVSSTYAPYTAAPDSPHVLWKQILEFGGIVGGSFGDIAYYTGLSYEQFYNPLILQGRIYYVEHGPSTTAAYGTHCIDLYTGQELWFLNNTNIVFAQVLEFDSPNEHGALPFLWSISGSGTNQTWRMYDALNGRLYLTVINVPGGSASRRGATVFGPNGEILSYYLNSANGWLSMWNSTLAIVGPPPNDYWSPTYGSTIDGSRGIQWNVTTPKFRDTIVISHVSGGYILASNITNNNAFRFSFDQLAFPATLNRQGDGSYPTSITPLWQKTRDIYMASYKWTNTLDDVYVMFDDGTLQFHCYSILTGDEVWVTDPLPTGWSIFTFNFYIGYDKLYAAGYDGHVRAYDINNGDLVWDYYFGSAGYETPYGTWPNYAGVNIADGKVFVCNDEHSPDSVLWRGGKLVALDANTGSCLWNISGWLRQGAISDGYYTALNSLDGQIYVFGKGPSATTVEAPLTAVPLGSGVTITGTVTDQSPGAKDTPAISDADMGAWMEYLHMLKAKPQTAKGVQVTLVAIDSNGNVEDIGSTTSDLYGHYGISWTPKTQGLYQVIANFAGTNSYGDSSASTYLSIGPAAASPQPTSTPTSSPTSTPPPATASPTTSPSPAPTPPGTGLATEYYVAIAAVVIIATVAAVAIFLKRRK